MTAEHVFLKEPGCQDHRKESGQDAHPTIPHRDLVREDIARTLVQADFVSTVATVVSAAGRAVWAFSAEAFDPGAHPDVGVSAQLDASHLIWRVTDKLERASRETGTARTRGPAPDGICPRPIPIIRPYDRRETLRPCSQEIRA